MQFKKSLLNLTQEQIEDKIMKQIHPSSRVKITTLPPELARIRIESQSQRQRKHRIRTIQKKHEPQPIVSLVFAQKKKTNQPSDNLLLSTYCLST